MSKILKKQDFGPHGFRWLTLKRITYEDPRGRVRFWESAERTSRQGNVDGVAIITLVHAKEQPLKVILESQFRPTQGNHVIEFPAGLIDKGETAAEAALRELKEETGYVGRVSEISPVCYSDPGMTNTNMQFAVLDVDADAPENQSTNPELEDGEFIDVFLLPYDGLYDALVAKQQETGWDIDARLLLYADAIKRTEMLTRKCASAEQHSPPPDNKQTSSDPAVADSLNCQDGMPKGLHIKTRHPASRMSASAPEAHKQSAEQHADGNHVAHQPPPDKEELAQQAHQEGFIGSADPSPAVLKTEFPPKLEPHLEQPAKTQQDAPDGEILLENEVPPGHNNKPTKSSPEKEEARGTREPVESRKAQRSSIDLAAGLARSPQKALQGTDDSCELNSSLFPSFQRVAPAEGQADGTKDVFATPFERQGSLIHLEPMHATGNSSDDRASQNGEGVVYCPVGTPTTDSRQAGDSQEHAREHAERGADPDSAGKILPRQEGASPDPGSQSMLFGAGVAVGGVAGALLTYIGSLQRHQG